ncbi:hypothetical protein PENNAL_c0206G07101 [Penicillium nalgiovense]|uniref:Uncharacterized protein n=1 Tax=Penicillium nalgiovense TaxID=60175 RepID=A0A1V6WRK5_PENNA|nr:hypothetical protein PENNAL_c0206G07101 [Penicillium nalgiovense]
MKASTQTKVDNMRTLAGGTLTLTNLRDRRVLIFWLLQIVGIFHFILWLIVASEVAAIPLCFDPLAASFISEPKLGSISRATISKHFDRERKARVERSLQQISIDVWFGLGFTVVMDAFAVVLTFNRALVRKFHNAVSQRLIFLASIILWIFSSWSAGNPGFSSSHPVLSLAGGLILHWLLGSTLDKLEKRTISSPSATARRGTFAQYSKDLGLFEISWVHAVFLTAMVGGLVADSITEWCKEDTSLYFSVLSSILCRCLVLMSRVLLDAHLLTVLRSRSELKWARKNVLISTPRLLAMCIIMLFLENCGVRVITYIKPISVLGFFGLGITGYMGAAAYDIAAKLTY